MKNVVFSTRNIDEFISDIANEVVRKISDVDTKSSDRAIENQEVLTIEEAAEFLHLKKATIYGKVSKGELPVMKRSKRLYFLKDDLIEYLKDGRVGSLKEAQGDVMSYILNKK